VRTAFLVIGSALALTSTAAAAQETAYKPSYEVPEGDEVVAVYLGASSCHGCNDPDLLSALKAMKSLLASKAEESGLRFSVIGVGMDWSVAESISYLESVGPFDEIIAGRIWASVGAVKFLWTGSEDCRAIPQVLLIERTTDFAEGEYAVTSERELARYMGKPAIVEWVRAGAPIPEKPVEGC
jgi:hypothetical protein